MTTEKERIEVALSLAAGMLDLDAEQMDDKLAAHNCRGAARIIREHYELLVAAPALRERVAALEGALAEIDRLEETYNGRGALHHKWLVREIVKRAAAALPAADGAGRAGE